MSDGKKKGTFKSGCLKFAIGAFVLIGGCLYILRSETQARNKAIQDVKAQLAVGSSIFEFVPPNPMRVFLDFHSEDGKVCLNYIGSYNRVNLEIMGQKKKMKEATQLPQILKKHREDILHCSKIKLTVFGGRTPARTTAKFSYDSNGQITRAEKPYTWD